MEEEKQAKGSFQISAALYRTVRIKAAEEEISMSQFIRKALTHYLTWKAGREGNESGSSQVALGN